MSVFPLTSVVQRRLHRGAVRGLPSRPRLGRRILAPVFSFRRKPRARRSRAGRRHVRREHSAQGRRRRRTGRRDRTVRSPRRAARSARVDRRPAPPSSKPEFHGIAEADLRRCAGGGARPSADAEPPPMSFSRLRELYCGALGYEFEHVSDETERNGFARRSSRARPSAPLTADEKKALLERLTEVDGLERFLGRAYVSVKRFSIEGVDALVPMLDEAIARGGRRRRAAGRDRDGASRAAERADARDGQVLSRAARGVRGSGTSRRRTPRATRAT